jgi:hypothetical protein
MAITIDDFNRPEDRPWGMLRGYERAAEKENVLAAILLTCVEAGDFIPVGTKYKHPTIMVSDGLLEETPQGYMLTKKSLGLLYTVYGKD